MQHVRQLGSVRVVSSMPCAVAWLQAVGGNLLLNSNENLKSLEGLDVSMGVKGTLRALLTSLVSAKTRSQHQRRFSGSIQYRAVLSAVSVWGMPQLVKTQPTIALLGRQRFPLCPMTGGRIVVRSRTCP